MDASRYKGRYKGLKKIYAKEERKGQPFLNRRVSPHREGLTFSQERGMCVWMAEDDLLFFVTLWHFCKKPCQGI